MDVTLIESGPQQSTIQCTTGPQPESRTMYPGTVHKYTLHVHADRMVIRNRIHSSRFVVLLFHSIVSTFLLAPSPGLCTFVSMYSVMHFFLWLGAIIIKINFKDFIQGSYYCIITTFHEQHALLIFQGVPMLLTCTKHLPCEVMIIECIKILLYSYR